MDDIQENASDIPSPKPQIPTQTPTPVPVTDTNTGNEMNAVQGKVSDTEHSAIILTPAPVADENTGNEMDNAQENTSNTPSYNPPTLISPSKTGNKPIVKKEIHFTGFWKRVAISLSETLVVSLLVLFISPTAAIFPVLINIILYFATGRTIGDFIMQTKLVDAVSHQKPSTGQLIGRFFAKILSIIPFNLGFFWAGWTKEKKAWHDSLSGTRYVETTSYNGGITWIANILLLIVIPYFQMQPLMSSITEMILRGQGISTGEMGQELEGMNSFGDAIRTQMAKEEEIDSELMGKIEEELEQLFLEGQTTNETSRLSLTKEKDVLLPADGTQETLSEGVTEEPQPIGMSRYTTTTNAVFYDDKKLELADPSTFSLFAREEDPYILFGKDTHHVYLESTLIQNADPNTFEIVGDVFSKDKNRVFFYTRELPYVDSATFEELEDGTLQDKDNILTLTGEIKSPRISLTKEKDVLPPVEVLEETPSEIKRVQIGDQIWMQDYLNVGTKVDDPSRTAITAACTGNSGTVQTIGGIECYCFSETIASCQRSGNGGMTQKYCHGNLESNCDTNGALYEWQEAMDLPAKCVDTDCSTQINTPHQGICPDGWHIPTDDEWKTLEGQLGMTTAQQGAADWRGTDEGDKMKTQCKSSSKNCNTSGFSALFVGDGSSVSFWSSSQLTPISAWIRALGLRESTIYRFTNGKSAKLFLRCLKD